MSSSLHKQGCLWGLPSIPIESYCPLCSCGSKNIISICKQVVYCLSCNKCKVGYQRDNKCK